MMWEFGEIIKKLDKEMYYLFKEVETAHKAMALNMRSNILFLTKEIKKLQDRVEELEKAKK